MNMTSSSSSDSIVISSNKSSLDGSSSSERPRFLGDGDGDAESRTGDKNTSFNVSFEERNIAISQNLSVALVPLTGVVKGVGGTEVKRDVVYPSLTPGLHC